MIAVPSNMGDLNLGEAIEILKVVRRDMELGNRLSPVEITSHVRSNIFSGNYKQELENLLNAMKAYGPTSQNPAQDRTNYITRAGNARDVLAQHLGPILRTDAAQVNTTLTEVESLKGDLEDLKAELTERTEELKKQQQAVAASSGATASSDLARFYKDQADSHRGSARIFLIGAAVAGLALVALVIVAFGLRAPESSPNDWTEFAGGAIFRVLLLSVAGFALVFCVRNYRVNKHLEVLNKRRENALETFGLFQGAVTSEDARNLIVGELVRAVFAHEDTGYVTADSERTIIESPGGVVSALASLRGRES